MPVWWYPCSRMSCVPASTRAAFVVALALGPVSAVACSAIDCLLHTEIIDQSVTLVKPRVGYLEKNSRALGVVYANRAVNSNSLHTRSDQPIYHLSGGADHAIR